MNNLIARIAAAVSLCAPLLPAHAQQADAGKQVFKVCTACHATGSLNGAGPGLQGIVGRKAGSATGFRYSQALLGSNLTWDDASLDAFIRDPKQAVPGNVMAFSGLPDAKQRADVVAYLKTLR